MDSPLQPNSYSAYGKYSYIIERLASVTFYYIHYDLQDVLQKM